MALPYTAALVGGVQLVETSAETYLDAIRTSLQVRQPQHRTVCARAFNRQSAQHVRLQAAVHVCAIRTA